MCPETDRVYHSIMHNLIIVTLTLLCCVAVASARADFEHGIAAFQQGSYDTAFEEWRPLAEEGHIGAQIGLGLMYATGKGVLEDDVEAEKWYRLAAEQGNALAQYNLGVIYRNGRGVARDPVEGAKWYRLAAEQGVAAAQFNLGNMLYEEGEWVAENYVEAIRWYVQAAEQGLVVAQAALGSINAGGVGVPKNYVTAYLWWSLAATQGHKIAAKNLDILMSQMTMDEIAEGARLVNNWGGESE